jgi:hypothetical protein
MSLPSLTETVISISRWLTVEGIPVSGIVLVLLTCVAVGFFHFHRQTGARFLNWTVMVLAGLAPLGGLGLVVLSLRLPLAKLNEGMGQ